MNDRVWRHINALRRSSRSEADNERGLTLQD